MIPGILRLGLESLIPAHLPSFFPSARNFTTSQISRTLICLPRPDLLAWDLPPAYLVPMPPTIIV